MDKIYILQNWGKKISLYIHDLVLVRGSPSLEGKHECFVTKEEKTFGQVWVRQAIDIYYDNYGGFSE